MKKITFILLWTIATLARSQSMFSDKLNIGNNSLPTTVEEAIATSKDVSHSIVKSNVSVSAVQLNLGYNPAYVGTGNGCISGGTCYYIDFENGSDNNDGLTKATAWKTTPGMANATGNPMSHSFSQTDEFILKGGVTWPFACYPWDINSGGAITPNTYAYPGMYIGYDPTWNKGNVNSIRVTDPGVNCTSLAINITGGGGTGATAGRLLLAAIATAGNSTMTISGWNALTNAATGGGSARSCHSLQIFNFKS